MLLLIFINITYIYNKLKKNLSQIMLIELFI